MRITYAESLDHDRRQLATVRDVIDMPIVRVAVEHAVQVPPVSDASRQFNIVQSCLDAFADTMTRIGSEMREERRRRLPHALVGKSGLVADEALWEMAGEAFRTARIFQAAAEEIEDRGRLLRSQHHAHDADALQALRQLYNGPIAFMSMDTVPNPVPPSLTEEVRRVASAAIAHINERRAAHSALAASLDELSAFLDDLTGQAVLAKLGPSPLAAIDELVIANARTYETRPVLTAHAAGVAARELAAMPDDQRKRVEDLLNRARSRHERAYLLKAVAAGNDLQSLTDFADRIRSKHPGWLERQLDPLGAARGPLDDGQPSEHGSHALAATYQTKNAVAHAVLGVELRTDPVAALRITDPEGAGTYSERFAARAHELASQVRPGQDWTMANYAQGLQNTMWQQLPTPLGLYDGVETGNPVSQETMARIESSVDQGVPAVVLLGNSAGTEDIARTSTALIVGHNGPMLQVHYADGTLTWVNRTDFMQGSLDRTPSVPVRVFLPN